MLERWKSSDLDSVRGTSGMPGVCCLWDAQTRRRQALLSRPTRCRGAPLRAAPADTPVRVDAVAGQMHAYCPGRRIHAEAYFTQQYKPSGKNSKVSTASTAGSEGHRTVAKQQIPMRSIS